MVQIIVKILELGLDFVLLLSQQQQEQIEEPHQNP